MIKKYFENLGFIKNKIIKKKHEVDISTFVNGVNQFNEYVVVKNKKEIKINYGNRSYYDSSRKHLESFG